MKVFYQWLDIFYQFVFTVLALYLIFLLLRYPALSLAYASTGLMLWFQKMIPTLLPFMILSGIMIRMNLTERFVGVLHPFLHRLYKTSPNGSYTILMGFLCGFPMGARIIGELCQAGKLSREEGGRLLLFCNNIGPVYFLSFVVPTLSIEKPLVPFCMMYGIPLLYGLFLMRLLPFLRKRGPKPLSLPETALESRQSAAPMGLLEAVDHSIASGLTGIARLGGYMVFFNLLNIAFVPFRHVSQTLLSLYNCLLEITSGIDRGGQSLFYPILVLLPFGGLSCIAQTYSMIQHTGLSMRSYVFHKIIQTLITALGYLLYSYSLRS